MATPFVQGHLRNQQLSVEIHTHCVHCERPLHLTLDSRMNHFVHTAEAEPLIFQPQVNWEEFSEPNILHAY